MSQENLQKFTALVSADPVLAERVQAIHVEASQAVADRIAALSAEVNLPFTAEEFFAQAGASAAELSDEQLESVAGGEWGANDANVMFSLSTLGIGCGFAASLSVMITGKRTADDCQPSKWGKR